MSGWLTRSSAGNRGAHTPGRCKPRRFQPQLERLESREVLDMSIGMNLDSVVDYNPDWMFTDAFLESRSWISYAYNTATGIQNFDQTPVAIDERGWPTALATSTNDQGQVIQQRLGTIMFDNLNSLSGAYPTGIYHVQWEGEGTIAWSGDAQAVEEGLTADGQHYALLSVTTATNFGIHMRIDSMDSADPIRNIHVWMPDYNGQSFVGQVWRPGADFSPFHPLFLERLDAFDTIRFQQPQDTNTSHIADWSDLRPIDYARQTTTATDFQNGLSLEYMIELANELDANPWFCMPHTASDDFVRTFAQTVQAQLEPGLVAYVEWSNEAWNPSGAYIANTWLTEQMALPENAGLTFHQLWAREAERDFLILADEFADQPERLVRVLAGFAGNSWTTNQVLQNMNGNYDAIAVGGYIEFARPQLDQFDENTTPEQVIDAWRTQALPYTLQHLQEHQDLADQYGAQLGREIDLLVYEGGPIAYFYNQPFDGAFREAIRRPEIYDLYRQLLDGAEQIGVDLFTAYVYIDTSPFGDSTTLRYQNEPLEDAHRYRALVDYIAAHEPTPPNLPPVNAAPTAQLVGRDAVLIFSAANGNAISISDADAGTAAVQVTLTATHGTLSLATTGSAEVAGDGTSSVVLTGTLADINAALEGLAFTPDADYSGPAQLQIVTDDQGNSGAGGALTDTDAVDITVVASATVQSVVVNNGRAQRSMVTRIRVTFSGPVRLDAGAFTLVRTGANGGPVALAGYTPGGIYTSVTLTFPGRLRRGGSLADGNYRLTINAHRIHETTLDQDLDGDGDGTPGGNRMDAFFRRFGDSDGDRDVDQGDARRFSRAFGQRRGMAGYRWYFDENADGRINWHDYWQFWARARRWVR